MNKDISNAQILQAVTELTDQVGKLNISHENLSNEVQGLKNSQEGLASEFQDFKGSFQQSEERLSQKIDKQMFNY